MTTPKENILKYLKELGRLPTTRITALIGSTYNYTKKYLQELKAEKLIIEEKETNATYWRLNK